MEGFQACLLHSARRTFGYYAHNGQLAEKPGKFDKLNLAQLRVIQTYEAR